MSNNNNSDFIIFKTEDEKISVDVRFEGDTVWLSQDQMANLFGKGRTTITEHIQNIFKEGELNEDVVCRNFRHTTQHGAIEGKTQETSVKLYNLDVIISVGYRVKSQRGTQFRIWATKRLNEYIRKGFAMDDERLKNLDNKKTASKGRPAPTRGAQETPYRAGPAPPGRRLRRRGNRVKVSFGRTGRCLRDGRGGPPLVKVFRAAGSRLPAFLQVPHRDSPGVCGNGHMD